MLIRDGCPFQKDYPVIKYGCEDQSGVDKCHGPRFGALILGFFG